jgi:ABC-type lipoprotein release transport system permease subunit
MDENQNNISEKNWREKIGVFFSDEKNRKRTIAFLVAFVLAIFLFVAVSPPANFPRGKVVTVG